MVVDINVALCREVTGTILRWLWPSRCVLCSGPGRIALDLCNDCHADLPRNEVACARCAQPLAVASPAIATLLCGGCLRRPPHFDVARCAFRYAYPVDHLVRALKFRGAVTQARVLGELLAAHIADRSPQALPACLIPVPLARKRFQARGYNQAIEISRSIERRLGIPLRTELVVRMRETTEQAGMKKHQRRRNVRGAFTLTAALPAKHVAIVDDVITTGSTANELARVLKRAGADRVEVWAVARAGRAG